MTESHSDLSGAKAPSQRPPESWDRELLTRLASESLREQRRARRWGIFFKLSLMVYLVVVLILYLPRDLMSPSTDGAHTALVEIRGIIADDTEASADRIISGLREAFEDEDTAGVIVRINSPGGSPVQSGYINDEMGRLREKYPETPLYAVITDICASGGYYVAAAADKVYADKSSIVGSIGVLMNGFGFVETMNKLGVERRLFTAGEHKGLLDPFSPTRPDEVSHINDVLEQMHQQFIDVVRAGRGERLNNAGEQLFSGLVWTGERSVELGLVDALGSSSYVAREIIGAERIVDFTPRVGYLERFAKQIGAAMSTRLMSSLVPDIPRLQ